MTAPVEAFSSVTELPKRLATHTRSPPTAMPKGWLKCETVDATATDPGTARVVRHEARTPAANRLREGPIMVGARCA